MGCWGGLTRLVRRGWNWRKIQLGLIGDRVRRAHAAHKARCAWAIQEALMDAELTIVIPAKNEIAMLPKLLESLCRQDYEGMAATRVLVAGAGSTGGTVGAALGFCDRLRVEVVKGGLPSVGRNAGAKLATTKYVLFLDADVELPEPTLLRRALWRMERRELHLVTTNIACREGGFFD